MRKPILGATVWIDERDLSYELKTIAEVSPVITAQALIALIGAASESLEKLYGIQIQQSEATIRVVEHDSSSSKFPH